MHSILQIRDSPVIRIAGPDELARVFAVSVEEGVASGEARIAALVEAAGDEDAGGFTRVADGELVVFGGGVVGGGADADVEVLFCSGDGLGVREGEMGGEALPVCVAAKAVGEGLFGRAEVDGLVVAAVEDFFGVGGVGGGLELRVRAHAGGECGVFSASFGEGEGEEVGAVGLVGEV